MLEVAIGERLELNLLISGDGYPKPLGGVRVVD